MINQHNSLIGFLVYDAQRAIAKSLETALKPYEITPGQWNLINQLDSAGELSQKQLAERTRKEQATITRYLDTLERKGLVVRNQHKSDRRAHAISVTEKAHELVVTAQPVTVEAADRLIEGIERQHTDELAVDMQAAAHARMDRQFALGVGSQQPVKRVGQIAVGRKAHRV